MNGDQYSSLVWKNLLNIEKENKMTVKNNNFIVNNSDMFSNGNLGWFNVDEPQVVRCWDSNNNNKQLCILYNVEQSDTYPYKVMEFKYEYRDLDNTELKTLLANNKISDLMYGHKEVFKNVEQVFVEETVSGKVTVTRNGVDSVVDLTSAQLEGLGIK